MRATSCVRLPVVAARRSRMSAAERPQPPPHANGQAAASNGDAAEHTQPAGAILGLPAPRPAADGEAPVRSVDLSSGATVSLDALGPVVVNVDGTLCRIGNWAAMTLGEQATTQRRISERNNQRLAALRAQQTLAPPLD